MVANGFLKELQKTIVKNAPTILAVLAGLGAAGTVALTIRGTIKSQEDLKTAKEERQKAENNPEADISTADKALIYAKNYWPAAAMLFATEGCIYGSHHINKKRFAALASAYILKETDFEKYKKDVESILGREKSQELKDAILEKHVNETEPNEANTSTPAKNVPQYTLWWDESSQRYFYTNAETVRKVDLEARNRLQAYGWVGINDIYKALGMSPLPIMDNEGWEHQLEEDDVDWSEPLIKIGAVRKSDIDDAVNTIQMEPNATNLEQIPSDQWCGAV